MSRESEPEQPQRTVAELLAEYGNSGEGAPRRRRRRAEDDEEVSGPQAIINRVNSDSGIMPVIRQDPQTGEPIAPSSARSHRRLRPVGQPPAPQQAPPPQQPPARQAPPPQQQPQGAAPRAPQQPPQPPQQQSGAFAPTAYAQPVQPQAPNGQPPPARPAPQQNPPTGRQPLPPSAPSRPAMSPAQPQGGQPPASRAPAQPQSRPAMPPSGPPSRSGLPPAGPGNAQTSRPAMPPVAPPGRVSPPLAARPPVDDYPADDDFTEQGYGNAPQGLSQQQVQQAQNQPPGNPLQSRLGGAQRPEAAMTEELPPVVDGPPAQQRPAQQTGTFRARPVMRRAPADSPLEATQAHPGPLESTQAHPAPYLDDEDEENYDTGFARGEYEGEATQYSRPPQPPPGPRNQGTQLINPNRLADDGYPDEGYEHDGYPAANDYPVADDYQQDEFPARGAAEDVDLDSYGEPYDRDRLDPRDRRDELSGGADDLDDVPVSTGREWLVTAAQVGVGAIAGAAVWLGFSWLWGLMPIAAIVAAVVVVIGLIVVVRKWRKAEDLQTTVLAILAGLVVTVSPAALLLVRR
jgi:hypothetical protein